MNTGVTTLRKATDEDLDAINHIIEAAVTSWELPDRVKRLSLPSYQYNHNDLDSLKLVVAVNDNQQVVGVVAWEPADPRDVPQDRTGLLVHGLYVDADHQRQGIGKKLLTAAEQAATDQNFDGLLIKAQSSATGFFKAQNLEQLKVENENRDYMYRYWKPIKER